MWAFGYDADQASQLWDRIPLDTDIVVTHTPPKFHCDERKDRRAVGCEVLRQVLWRVRPPIHVCGHVHESRGVDRITWDLTASNFKYKEAGVEHWQDPGDGNNKLSLLDLTRRSGKPIDNDGAPGDYISPSKAILPADPTTSSSSPSLNTSLSSGQSEVKLSIQESDNAFSDNDLIQAVHGQGGLHHLDVVTWRLCQAGWAARRLVLSMQLLWRPVGRMERVARSSTSLLSLISTYQLGDHRLCTESSIANTTLRYHLSLMPPCIGLCF
jgi:hypothetical protein